MVKENTYICIQSWMRNELNLNGTELMTYAIIYGFSQDGESRFKGSRQYIADWCGCTIRSVQTALNELVDKNLITKYENIVDGQKFCEYSANSRASENISRASEKISLNNIADNIEENIITINSNNKKNSEVTDYESHAYSKEELKQESKDSFLGSAKRTIKPKRKSLYDKCVDLNMQFTKDVILVDLLNKYLSVRLAIKDKPIYGVNQWAALLDKLTNVSDDSRKVVQQSIENGWCSFYPLKDNKSYNKKDTFSEGNGISCAKTDKTEEELKDILDKQGKRSEF